MKTIKGTVKIKVHTTYPTISQNRVFLSPKFIIDLIYYNLGGKTKEHVLIFILKGILIIIFLRRNLE